MDQLVRQKKIEECSFDSLQVRNILAQPNCRLIMFYISYRFNLTYFSNKIQQDPMRCQLINFQAFRFWITNFQRLQEAARMTTERGLELSQRIIREQFTKGDVISFHPYKSLEEDGLFPALLQIGLEKLLPLIIRLLGTSIVWNYIQLPGQQPG